MDSEKEKISTEFFAENICGSIPVPDDQVAIDKCDNRVKAWSEIYGDTIGLRIILTCDMFTQYKTFNDFVNKCAKPALQNTFDDFNQINPM